MENGFMPNAEQARVIDFYGGRAMVLAAPGCGKTATLVHRIIKAHAQYNVPYSDMLCLTFTNRAAREMRARAKETLKDDVSDLFIGNLHRFCSRFLFLNQCIPIDTGIIDDKDQAEIIQDLAAEMHLGSIMAWEVNAVLDQACKLRERKGNIPFNAHSDRKPWDRAEELAEQYLAYLRKNHLIDYDDILYYTYHYLTHQNPDRPLIGSQFGWIQVDEVQDLNSLQLALIHHLAKPDATIMFLGDDRQSIFSFMGAKGENLSRLMQRCEPNVFTMNRNYRAPIYMLDMLNDYARTVLKVEAHKLPQSSDHTNIDNAIQAVECNNRTVELSTIGKIVKHITAKAPEEQVGILVRNNKDVEQISATLAQKGIKHLAISNKDIFKSDTFKTLYSHFAVIALDTAFTDWIRILYQTKTLLKYSQCREYVHRMRKLGITPRDLIDYPNSTYILEFAKAFGHKDMVVFDTETTGTDTYNDDIIQIAACRIHRGEIVEGSELDIMIRSEKPIPPTLSNGLVNPMVAEYARRAAIPKGQPGALLEPEEAFEIFREYVADSQVIGHNVRFDIDMLYSNLSRRAPGVYIPSATAWDTLALTRRLDPNLRKYTLQELLIKYNLEGKNSHNAADDVAATAKLAQHLYSQAHAREHIHKAFLVDEEILALADHLRKNYGDLYRHTQLLMDRHNVGLTDEMEFVYQQFLQKGYIQEVKGLSYVMKLFDGLLFKPETEPYFAQQLNNHLHELRTFNEADFYENKILDRNVHIMTIHKAKGLQFDNVILPDISEGIFPHPYTTTPEEDARLLYVGLSRARKRLIMTHIGRLSPFIANHPEVAEHFDQLHSYQG